jgi:CRP-like cAMP-binding protein
MPSPQLFRFDSSPTIYEPGDTIFREGETCTVMYVLVEGSVELSRHGERLEIVEPGGVFGEMALVEHSTRSATAVALSRTVVSEIDERRFQYLVQNTPTFALDVLRALARRLRAVDERFT